MLRSYAKGARLKALQGQFGVRLGRLMFSLPSVQWNTCNAGLSDGIIFISVTVSPRARNTFPATTLSRSSKSS